MRSLIDRHVVEDTGTGYELVGSLGELRVPESLHALLASRLDALDAVARSLAGDAAVIGGAVHRRDAGRGLRPGHRHRWRRDWPSSRAETCSKISGDALSPQIGAYGFTHGLLGQVAYQTLSRRDLKERRLRVAEHLETSTRNEGDALAEVIARQHVGCAGSQTERLDVETLRGDGAASGWCGPPSETHRPARRRRPLASSRLRPSWSASHQDEDAASQAADLWMRAAKVDDVRGGDYERGTRRRRSEPRLRAEHGHDRLVALVDGLRGRALAQSGLPEQSRALLRRAMAVLEDETESWTRSK